MAFAGAVMAGTYSLCVHRVDVDLVNDANVAAQNHIFLGNKEENFLAKHFQVLAI